MEPQKGRGETVKSKALSREKGGDGWWQWFRL